MNKDREMGLKNREFSHKIFNEIIGLKTNLQSIAGIVQNPDFAVYEDIVTFREDCLEFEYKFDALRSTVERMYRDLK